MFSFVKKPLFVNPTVLILLFGILCSSFTFPNKAEVTLPAGTAIPLELVTALRSDLVSPGQLVDFKVTSDIIAEGQVVIPAGSTAKGQVTRAQKAKGIGKEGFVEIQIRSVKLIDGQELLLTASNLYNEGESKQTLSIVLGVVVCILFLLMKGKNAEVAPGYRVDAVSAVTAKVTIDR